jgi:hypothetical protein
MEKSLSEEQYKAFEAAKKAFDAAHNQETTAKETGRSFIFQAVREIAQVVEAGITSPPANAGAEGEPNAQGGQGGGGGGIVHVATLTKVDIKPPVLCRSALELIYEALGSNLISLNELSQETRTLAYQNLAEFLVKLKIETVAGVAVLVGKDGDLQGLINLNTLLLPLLQSAPPVV